MADTPLNPEEFDLLAAELALGVLEGPDRAQALRLQVADPAFREAVLMWQTRFEPLLYGYAEAEAPDLWYAIEQRLPAYGAAPTESATGMVQHRLHAWRRGALTAGAVAAGLAAILIFRPVPTPAPAPQIAQISQPAVAQLGDAEAAHQFAVNYDATSGELRIRALKMPQSDLTPELWLIPADNVPRSLGLVSATGSSRVIVAPALRAMISDGTLLAISMEKPEGAPHKAPSSTPVAAGPINKI